MGKIATKGHLSENHRLINADLLAEHIKRKAKDEEKTPVYYYIPEFDTGFVGINALDYGQYIEITVNKRRVVPGVGCNCCINPTGFHTEVIKEKRHIKRGSYLYEKAWQMWQAMGKLKHHEILFRDFKGGI